MASHGGCCNVIPCYRVLDCVSVLASPGSNGLSSHTTRQVVAYAGEKARPFLLIVPYLLVETVLTNLL
jgi:hypothetical protein